MLMDRLAGEMEPERAAELIEAGAEPLRDLIAALHRSCSSRSCAASAPRATEPADLYAVPARMRWQADWCDRLGSPLYGELLRRSADDAEAGGPVAEALAGREDDPLESMLQLRFMGAVTGWRSPAKPRAGGALSLVRGRRLRCRRWEMFARLSP